MRNLPARSRFGLLFALLLLLALGVALGGIRWQGQQQTSPADAARAKVKANFAQIADSIEGHSGTEAAQSCRCTG